MAPRIWVARFLLQKKPYHRVRAAHLCSHLGCLPRGCIVPPADPVSEKWRQKNVFPVFVQDLQEELGAALGHNAGLCSLGNTCNMNSTLQCLHSHSDPELKSALLSDSDFVRANGVAQTSLNTFGDVDQSTGPDAPLHFLQGHIAGLCNLGNTYGMSSLQCLHSVPEFKSASPRIHCARTRSTQSSVFRRIHCARTESPVFRRSLGLGDILRPQRCRTSRSFGLTFTRTLSNDPKHSRQPCVVLGDNAALLDKIDSIIKDKSGEYTEAAIKDRFRKVVEPQSLMYDFGIITPDDGTNVDFYKGECDGSYDERTGLARLSFLLFKITKILCCQIYHGVPCESSVQAEAFAAAALLFAAEQNGVQKMVLCTDCEATHIVLSGEKNLRFPDKDLGVLVMLREQRKRFARVVSMWKPRELNSFADELCTLDMEISLDPLFLHKAMDRWKTQMEGSPVFRFKQKNEISKITNVFGDVPSFGDNLSSAVRLHVENVCKFECLVGLQDGFEPDDFYLAVHGFDKKPEEVQLKIFEFFGDPINFCDTPGEKSAISIFHNADSLKNIKLEKRKSMMVYFDTRLWGKSFFKSVKCDMTVVLASREEAWLADRMKLRKLSALDYVRFNQK